MGLMRESDLNRIQLQSLKRELAEKLGRKTPPVSTAVTYCELGRSIRARIAVHGISAYRVLRECGITAEEMAHALLELAAYENRAQFDKGYREGVVAGISKGLRRTA